MCWSFRFGDVEGMGSRVEGCFGGLRCRVKGYLGSYTHSWP